jgi:hypothetical protein
MPWSQLVQVLQSVRFVLLGPTLVQPVCLCVQCRSINWVLYLSHTFALEYFPVTESSTSGAIGCVPCAVGSYSSSSGTCLQTTSAPCIEFILNYFRMCKIKAIDFVRYSTRSPLAQGQRQQLVHHALQGPTLGPLVRACRLFHVFCLCLLPTFTTLRAQVL